MTSSDPDRIVVDHARSPFNDIWVFEREGFRDMWFRSRGQFFLQSRIETARPETLVLVYTRLFMASLLFFPQPSRILIVGLGAGVLPRFLQEMYPHAGIDVVEMDPLVRDMACKHFGFREGGPLRVHLQDGREFLSRPGRRYDLILLDAFKGGSVPYHLKTCEFYRQIDRSLSPEGVLATNLYGKSNTLKPRDRATLGSVFKQFYVFEAPRRTATLGVATRQTRPWSEEEIREQVTRLPENLRRSLSWSEIIDMIINEKETVSPGTAFTDDFAPDELGRAVRKNNRDDAFRRNPYPIYPASG